MKFLIPTAVLLISASHLMAWNKPGHMLTGAIAYRELKATNPKALSNVVHILKQHPSYQQKWLPRIESMEAVGEKNHDLYLFMYAARWPDDARNTPDDREKWHYINFAFKPPGQPASVHTKEPDPENITNAFRVNVQTLLTSANAVEKAKALCWIFHLTGDIHQPLHTTALFTTEFPEGDRGGTRFYIKVEPDRGTISLHKFWDGLVQGSERFQSVDKRATTLRYRKSLKRSKLPELSETSFNGWAQESFALAKTTVYRNGSLLASTDQEDGEVLPSKYPKQVQPIAERRAVLAGYRLADLFIKWFGS
jgi:hypothetical protein